MGRERRITPRELYTGKIYEKEYFGEIDTNDPRIFEEIKKYRQPSKNPNFEFWMNFRDALKIAKEFQPIDKTDPERKRVDPANPAAPLLRDLKEALIEQWGLTDEEADDLKLYTAVGSPLDFLHKVDAFIDYEGRIVTLDLTLRTETGKKTADVIISGELPSPDDPKTEDAYLHRVDEIAADIIEQYKRKTPPKRAIIERPRAVPPEAA